MFVLRKYKASHCLFAVVLLCSLFIATLPCHAEQPPQHYVRERLACYKDSFIDLDCVPPVAPESLPRVQVEPIHLLRSQSKIRVLLEKYGYSNEEYEWELQIGDCVYPANELIYACENSDYGSQNWWEYEPRAPIDRSVKTLVKAEETVRIFLDELGLAYEYPLYKVKYLETDWRYTPKLPIIEVVARLEIEGMPCLTNETCFGKEDYGINPSTFFQITEDGKILNAVIRKPVKVVEVQEDTTPLLGWREILEKNVDDILEARYTDSKILQEIKDRYLIRQVELLTMLDKNNCTFPAWVFYTESLRELNGETIESGLFLNYCFDARTGARVDSIDLKSSQK